MNREITNIVFKELSVVQAEKIMREMETLAKQKHANCIHFYESRIEIEGLGFEENFSEMIESSSWESFLPREYYELKLHYNDKEEKRKAS